jgi:hypothetical protein
VLAPADMTAIAPPLVKVYASRHAPSRGEASAAVLYRDNWFWVSDRDLRSKRGMGFLMVLFMLAQTGTTVTPPVLTISKP